MIYLFGEFALDTDRRELRRATDPVAVAPQVFDLLVHLIENRDRVIGKDDLITHVWGGRIVSESALTTRINAARSAVGDSGEEQRLIRTLPRKGVRFVAEVREQPAPASAPDRAAAAVASSALFSLANKPSIAVLPFQNMSSDPEQDYLADGMVEEIITGLSRIKWLFVIARNSSFAYKGKSFDIRQVGRELGVRYVLEGSVRKAAERVRITGQLVEADSGRHIWAERYDRAVKDIFALQDEMTLNVIGAIEPSLRQAEIERVRRKRPENLDAYDLVMRARPFVDTAMPDGARRALPLLERALGLEPDYARAHGHAARCHHQLYQRAGRREEHRQKAIEHARAALAHGRDDAEALAEAGFVVSIDQHDYEAAREAFESALALSPSSAMAFVWGGIAAGWAGDVERAVEWGERALRLSPFDPHAFGAWHAVAIGRFQQGRYEEAVGAERKAIQRNPGFSLLYLILAGALVRLGRIEEAKAAATRLASLDPAFRIGAWRATTDLSPELSASLTRALRQAGLPE